MSLLRSGVVEVYAGQGDPWVAWVLQGDLPETLWAILGPSAGTSPKTLQNLLEELVLHTHLRSLKLTPCLQFGLHFSCCSGSFIVNSYLHSRGRRRLCHGYEPRLAIDSAAKILLLDSSLPQLLRGSG